MRFAPPDDDELEVRRVTAAAAARLFGGAAPPLCVGRFTLERKIGAGALGVVYAARDPSLDRVVALKLLFREHERLLDEARAMARLQHPNVVAVHEVGVDNGRVMLAMELVNGGTLRQWLAERQRPWRETIEVLLQAGRGLSAAHAANLVHRDFKPENVLVGADGRVRVTDFGLAVSDAPAGAGTPRYMAPEQHAHGNVAAGADQYAFCVTAWEALSGAPPFAAATDAAVVDAKMAGIVVTPSSTRVPSRVWRVLRRGLSPRADDRWPSIDALCDALRAAAAPPRTVTAAVGAVAVVVVLAAALLQMWMFADWRSDVRQHRRGLPPSAPAADAGLPLPSSR